MGGAEDHYTQHGDYKSREESDAVTGDETDDLKDYTTGSSIVDMWDTDKPAYGQNGTYNAFVYNKRATDIIHEHDPKVPLFMYLAWQEAYVLSATIISP